MKRAHVGQHIAMFLLICMAWAMPSANAAEGSEQVFANVEDLKWSAAPPSLPKGAEISVLRGDPGKDGLFVMRLKMPASYRIPPHWHSQAENLTVISGTLYLGFGDGMEGAAAHPLKPGGYHYLPGTVHHYAYAKEPTVVQVHGTGPFDITYINPADDPQQGAKPTH